MLAALKEIFTNPASVVFVNFHGLKVSDASALRRQLRGEGIRYLVAKKTLLKKALDGGSVAGELPPLDGELALAWGDDQLAPARGVYGFEKKLTGAVKILGGIFEGKFLGREEMVAIASIPPREVLYAQFVNLINSPIQRLAVALNEIAKRRN